MKRSISLVLAILMVASLMTFGTMGVSAEENTLIAWSSEGWKATDIDGKDGGETFDDLPDGWKVGEGITEWGTYTAPIGNGAYGGAFPLFDNGGNGALPALAAVKEFEVTDLDTYAFLTMTVDYDEDAVVYINGEQVFVAAPGWRVETINLTNYIDVLKEGTNTLAIEVKQGFGGSGFNLSLSYTPIPDQLVDANGYVEVKKADCSYYYPGLGDPSHMLNDNNGDCCGWGFNNQVWSLEFYGEVAVSEIYLQTKGKEEAGIGYGDGNFHEKNYTGDPTIFGFCSVYVGDILVATKVPARSAIDGGYTIKLSQAITASSVKVVCDEWLCEGPWANLNSLKVKAAETVADPGVKYVGKQVGNDGSSYRFIGSVTEAALANESVDLLVTVKETGKSYNLPATTVFKTLNGSDDTGSFVAATVTGSGVTAAPEATFDAAGLFGFALTGIEEGTYTLTIVPVANGANNTITVGAVATETITIG